MTYNFKFNHKQENFIDIDDFSNYQVSNFGNVKNVKTGRILKPWKGPKNHLIVCLCQDGMKKKKSLHRLVGITFLSNPKNKAMIDHIDNDPTNNNVLNLRWATSQENGMNKQKNINNKSGMKGVSYNKDNDKWNAQIMKKGKSIHLGYFDNVKDAGECYDDKAKKIFGEFAVLNSDK